MKRFIIFMLLLALSITAFYCSRHSKSQKNMTFIKQNTIDTVVNKLTKLFPLNDKELINRGVVQAASLWNKNDGKPQDFIDFCVKYYAGDSVQKEFLFQRLQTNFEILFGNFNKISLDLKRPLHVDGLEMIPVDDIFGGYDPYAHLNDDFFSNKIAFITILNFPFYQLEEKISLGDQWNRKKWAYARLGDMYTSRIPADVLQKFSEVATSSDMYISEYNIFMGNIIDNNNKAYFPKDMKLISHWGLRDELKANYKTENGIEKQKIIYQIMLRIINQEIPQGVINNEEVVWNPYTNKTLKNNQPFEDKPEPDTRYQTMLNLFHALQAIDKYNPQYPTYVERKFEQEYEIPQPEVEKLFIEFVSNPVVKDVAMLISKRLNRKLEPFDIWYDGFKPRSSISQDELDKKVREKYKTAEDFEKEIPVMLSKLQFSKEKAELISSRIKVDPARGSGHAWGAQMKGDKAYLRARVPQEGWNYKGFNIACHELGHNVEQTLSLYDVDYYSMNGVPNTGFTEALAFIFQKRDLDFLGISNNDPDKEYYMTLDNFWSCYEIMGVSLVDMKTWKWIYENPKATKEELKKAVIKNAIEVWNTYYADVFGVKDSPVLAIYSHMIDNPLYLSAYPIGQVIQFQIEEHLKGKNFADETMRMFTYGKTTPDAWMKHAVGQKLSINPIVQATVQSLKSIKQ